MNNNCITIKRHIKSFIHNINPLTWLKHWNQHDTIYLRRPWLAWEIIVQLFRVRDNFFSGIALAQKAFKWTAELSSIFTESMSVIIEEMKERERSFQLSRPTCLVTDWSTIEIGFCLKQKHCACLTRDITCCKRGWKLYLVCSTCLCTCLCSAVNQILHQKMHRPHGISRPQAINWHPEWPFFGGEWQQTST